ncbi:MAG: hypothetical protein HGB11_13610, partial [Chlorobiales bacterium]|nr:hypothetical protein [Chlorobiales bacterium]
MGRNIEIKARVNDLDRVAKMVASLTDEKPVDSVQFLSLAEYGRFKEEFPPIDLTIGVENILFPYCLKPEVIGNIRNDVPSGTDFDVVYKVCSAYRAAVNA